MGLLSSVREFLSPTPNVPMRSWGPWDFVNMGGVNYPLGLQTTMPGQRREDIDGSFLSFAIQGMAGNSVVFACMDAHRRLFTEARFAFRRMRNGTPGELFGTPALGILEQPWPNGTTGDLLARMINYADLAGNHYAARRPGNRIANLRPDWTSIILDAPAEDMDAQIMGYTYQPGGPAGGQKPVVLAASEVAHFAPIPDPLARYRGMSWMTPLVREIMADGAATAHKLAFFENGATPNMLVKRTDELGKDAFKEWVQLMETGHTGVANAYKTLYLTGGADATVIGANLRQLDFKVVQGAGETRIAAAAGIPPIIVGLSEGLQAATYSNYGQARRAYADLWARPMWRNAAASLATIVPVPGGAELWYDDRDIPFLAEDQRDAADIQEIKTRSVSSLITAGYKPDAAVKAVDAGDLSLLTGQHTGLYSVQLQPPGTVTPAAPAAPADQPSPMPMQPDQKPSGGPAA